MGSSFFLNLVRADVSIAIVEATFVGGTLFTSRKVNIAFQSYLMTAKPRTVNCFDYAFVVDISSVVD